MSLTSRRTAMARKRYKPEEIVAKLRQWMFWSRMMVCRQRGGHPRPGWRPQVRQGQVDGPHRRAGRACHDVVLALLRNTRYVRKERYQSTPRLTLADIKLILHP